MKPESFPGISRKRINHSVALVLYFLLILFSPPVFAQYTNVRINKPVGSRPEEVTIAINPVNPLNLVAGANLDNFYYTTDGGSTWTEGRLSSTLGEMGDPCIIYDADGNAYYGHLSAEGGGDATWLDRIVVQKSTDGGKTWNNGVGIGLNSPKHQDKAWLACDLTNPRYRNNLYVAWTEFDKYASYNTRDSSRILFSRSTDAGATWSTPVRVSDRGGNCLDSDSTVEGAVPAIGPIGEVYLSWSSPQGIMFDKSTDGGVRFGRDVYVTSQPGGWNFNVPGLQRCNGFPVTCCDLSGSPYQGTIYIMWSDQRNGQDNTDVFLIKSTDQGSTWGSIKRVNDDATQTHQFFPWMAVDQTTGYIYVVFYDRRNSSTIATDVYLARSTDGGSSFANFKISQIPFSPNTNSFLGDYIHLAVYSRSIHPIWTRIDSSALSIWTTLIRDAAATGVSETQRLPSRFTLDQNYPNPFNGSTSIGFSLPSHSHAVLTVHDVLGRVVRTLVEGEFEAGAHLAMFYSDDLSSGVYIYQLKTSQFLASKKLIITK